MKKIVSFAIFAVLIMSFISCTATMTRRSTKEQWTDAMTSSRVKWKMGQDKDVSSRNIDLNVWRGEVTMIGHVASLEEKTRAEGIAKEVQGVTSVKNYIEVVGLDMVDKPEIVVEKKVDKKTEKKAGPLVEPVTEPASVEKVAKEEKPVKESKEFAKKLSPKQPKTSADVSTAKISEDDLMEEPVQTVSKQGSKRQNGVSYQIGKELASTSSSNKNMSVDTEMPVDDITSQAEQELKELKARKKSN